MFVLVSLSHGPSCSAECQHCLPYCLLAASEGKKKELFFFFPSNNRAFPLPRSFLLGLLFLACSNYSSLSVSPTVYTLGSLFFLLPVLFLPHLLLQNSCWLQLCGKNTIICLTHAKDHACFWVKNKKLKTQKQQNCVPFLLLKEQFRFET